MPDFNNCQTAPYALLTRCLSHTGSRTCLSSNSPLAASNMEISSSLVCFDTQLAPVLSSFSVNFMTWCSTLPRDKQLTTAVVSVFFLKMNVPSVPSSASMRSVVGRSSVGKSDKNADIASNVVLLYGCTVPTVEAPPLPPTFLLPLPTTPPRFASWSAVGQTGLSVCPSPALTAIAPNTAAIASKKVLICFTEPFFDADCGGRIGFVFAWKVPRLGWAISKCCGRAVPSNVYDTIIDMLSNDSGVSPSLAVPPRLIRIKYRCRFGIAAASRFSASDRRIGPCRHGFFWGCFWFGCFELNLNIKYGTHQMHQIKTTSRACQCTCTCK